MPPATRSAHVARQDRTLVQDQHSRDRSTAQCAQDARDEGADGEAGDVAGPVRGNLREHADLGAQRANVAEAAQTVGGDELGAGAHGLVDGQVDEVGESGVFVLRERVSVGNSGF
jgi:hypothetical protein